jgi:membrane protein
LERAHFACKLRDRIIQPSSTLSVNDYNRSKVLPISTADPCTNAQAKHKNRKGIFATLTFYPVVRFRPMSSLQQHATPSDKAAPAHAVDRCSASRKAALPLRGWGEVLGRSFRRFYQKRLSGEAAAVAFYSLLAVFPALAAVVTLCGLFVNPEAVARNLQSLAGALPSGTAEVAESTLGRIAAQGGGRIGLGAGLAAAALWSASAAAVQLFGALNVAYGEQERRSLLRLTATAVVFALGATAFVALALGGVLGVPVALGAHLGPGGSTDRMLHLLRWPLLVAAVSGALALTYHYGPCRSCRRWEWTSWGGIMAALAWLLGSASISWYMQRVGHYDWLYGSVGGMLGFMLWAWISCVAVLLGAVLNAEWERQVLLQSDSVGEDN